MTINRRGITTIRYDFIHPVYLIVPAPVDNKIMPVYTHAHVWEEDSSRCLASLHNAPDVITVTDHHHFRKTLREEHDILISRCGQTLTPYWYIKRENPIEPQQMIDLKSVLSNPIWNRPEPEDFGAMIQLWKFLPAQNTYELQAALELHEISLTDFFRVLGTKPSDFPS